MKTTGETDTAEPEITGAKTDGNIGINTLEESKRTGFFSQLKHPVFRRKVLHTMWIFWSFVMLGFIMGQRGPSFLDLLIITNTDLKRGSAFFTGQAVGYLVGSFLMGVVYDKLTKSLLMFFSVFFMGVTVGIIPFCSPYVLMIAMCFLNAVCLGGVDTGGNAELFRIWGSESRQYLLAIHFAYSIGGTISPVVTEPFLVPKEQDVANTENDTYAVHQRFDTNTSSSWDATGSSSYSTFTFEPVSNFSANNITDVVLAEHTHVFIAYLIGSVLTVAFSIPFLVMFVKDRTRPKKREPGPEVENDNHLSKPLFGSTIFLLCLFYMLYSGAEDTFSTFLLTFTVKGLDWTKTQGSQVTSASWAALSIGRFLGIFTHNCISTVKLLFLCNTGLILSLLALLLSAHFQFFLGIWFFAVTVGLSMSVVFPAAFVWAEEDLFRVTGRVSAAILCSTAAGTMINPIILGNLMQQYTPMWYCYLLSADSVVCTAVFLVVVFLSRKYIKRKASFKQQLTVEVTRV
ncbi:sodium-dependent glucose transporter 1-like [Gigantopelta aegis]|uniref:sodium-dependent glucose transporter 1-like n=1 Tax=Gigantopelta aegis TaxID=1735272 RepID=UPI001B88D120|nr:sodium-dependent glucose transporter 1-like [Gigantopelta aegis]